MENAPFSQIKSKRRRAYYRVTGLQNKARKISLSLCDDPTTRTMHNNHGHMYR